MWRGEGEGAERREARWEVRVSVSGLRGGRGVSFGASRRGVEGEGEGEGSMSVCVCRYR